MISDSMALTLAALPAFAAGMAAPAFEAVSSDGRKITLSSLRRQGPVMLVFLRGFG